VVENGGTRRVRTAMHALPRRHHDRCALMWLELTLPDPLAAIFGISWQHRYHDYYFVLSLPPIAVMSNLWFTSPLAFTLSLVAARSCSWRLRHGLLGSGLVTNLLQHHAGQTRKGRNLGCSGPYRIPAFTRTCAHFCPSVTRAGRLNRHEKLWP